jgi:hypothetical protein
MTGRLRFGGRNAASSASVSEAPIGGCELNVRAAGNDSTHAPPIAPTPATTPAPPHSKRRDLI